MRSLIYYLLTFLNPLYHKFSKNSLKVLAYHTVPDSLFFEKQIQYLKSNYNIIDIHQLSDHLFRSYKLPENPLLITFDDGDISVYEKGLPVLKKYKIPCVLFIITGLINSSKAFWWKQVEKVFEMEGKSYSEARKKVRILKNCTNEERVNYLNHLNPIPSPQLTTSQLQEMANDKVYIANHTHTHPMINKCSNVEIAEELGLARLQFEEYNLKGYSVFAYPNGNWDKSTEEILANSGITMAFLFDHQINKEVINPLRISRIMVDTNTEFNEFKAKVSGVHSKLTRSRNK